MAKIRTLKPSVTRDMAERHFSAGMFNAILTWTRGPIRSLAEFYIPFRPFRVMISNAGSEVSHIFAIDATEGILDLFQFPKLPDEAELSSVDTRNFLPVTLEPAQARERVLEQVRRLTFRTGFFRMRDVRFDAVEIAAEIYMPYWVCFRGPDNDLRISVLDGVRRRPEGAKARHLIENWLRAGTKPAH